MAEEIPVALTQDQLSWGESQVRQMLKDRPLMTPCVKEGDEFWKWMVRQFAGEGGNGEIQWGFKDVKGLVPLWDAISRGPDKDHHVQALIYVSSDVVQNNRNANLQKGTPKSGPLLWASAFVELFNMVHKTESDKLDSRVKAGQVSRVAYIVENCVIEHQSVEEAHRFFQQVWIPHC
jgi:hypothetical protein